MRSAIGVILGILAACVLVSGCGRPTPSAAERAIERELPKFVGPAESYHVTVEGLRGTTYAQRVTAVGRRVRPQGTPVLDTMEIELRDVTYNPSTSQVERIGSATAMITVLAQDIANYLDSTGKVKNTSVTMEAPNRISIQAQPNFPGLPVSSNTVITVTGSLVSDGNYVNFDVTHVTAGGADLGVDAANAVSEAINPIVNLSSVPIAVRVTGVHVEAGTAVIQIAGEYPPATTSNP